MLEWSDYRILLAIARERTLTGAARRLKVDQSTVSRRLGAIEAAARARLFKRTPEGYVRTAALEAVLPQLENIEDQALSIERALVGRDALLEGTVRLATSESFAVWFVVPHLAGLRALQPGIRVELVTGDEPVDLSRQEADLSLRLRKPVRGNLLARRVGRAAWAVYASEAYLARAGVPAPRKRLERHDVLAFADPLRGTVGAKWLAEHGDRGRVALRSHSLLSQAAAVAAGLGVGPLPCVCGDVQPGLRRVPPGIIGHHDIWLVVHPDMKTSGRVRVVMDYIAKLVEDESALLTGQR
ncbi:MAG TPA: LysR family transcriptional regulator [Polyangiales bacterium]|nr:LysR family transcriptional regulator [Polyangiales bacterium]